MASLFALFCFDGEAGKVISAIASRLVTMGAPVHLNVVEEDSALGAAIETVDVRLYGQRRAALAERPVLLAPQNSGTAGK